MGAFNSSNIKTSEIFADNHPKIAVLEDRDKDDYPHLGTVSVKLSWYECNDDGYMFV